MRKNLKKQVLEILKKYPESRDSDAWLTIKLWCEFYPQFIIRDKNEHGELLPPRIELREILKLPKEDQCTRIQAIIQNEERRYLPTTWEVARKRKIAEGEWREYIKNGTVVQEKLI